MSYDLRDSTNVYENKMKQEWVATDMSEYSDE